jgi:hypothetical protein
MWKKQKLSFTENSEIIKYISESNRRNFEPKTMQSALINQVFCKLCDHDVDYQFPEIKTISDINTKYLFKL